MKSGKPRRVVDFQKLNQACLRQTHPTKAPFLQCMAVPPNSMKTVLDAWNGYHSVQLREEDRHLTTFITPWGRYEYCNLPQGHMAAGDTYTARYDEVTQGFKRMERARLPGMPPCPELGGTQCRHATEHCRIA